MDKGEGARIDRRDVMDHTVERIDAALAVVNGPPVEEIATEELEEMADGLVQGRFWEKYRERLPKQRILQGGCRGSQSYLKSENRKKLPLLPK